MEEPRLNVPHNFREWEEIDGSCKCTLTVEMPGGGMRAFGAEGKTPVRARIVAAFAAQCALLSEESDSDSLDSDASGTSSSESDESHAPADVLPNPDPVVQGVVPDPESNVMELDIVEDEDDSELEVRFQEGEQIIEFKEATEDPETMPQFVESVDASDIVDMDEGATAADGIDPVFQPISIAGFVPSSAEENDTFDDDVPLAVLQSCVLQEANRVTRDPHLGVERNGKHRQTIRGTLQSLPSFVLPKLVATNSSLEPTRTETVAVTQSDQPQTGRKCSYGDTLRPHGHQVTSRSPHLSPAKPLKSSKSARPNSKSKGTPERTAVAPPLTSSPAVLPRTLSKPRALSFTDSNSDSPVPDTPPVPSLRKRTFMESGSGSDQPIMTSERRVPHWMRKRQKTEHQDRQPELCSHSPPPMWNPGPNTAAGPSNALPGPQLRSSQVPAASYQHGMMQPTPLPTLVHQHHHVNSPPMPQLPAFNMPTSFGQPGQAPHMVPNHMNTNPTPQGMPFPQHIPVPPGYMPQPTPGYPSNIPMYGPGLPSPSMMQPFPYPPPQHLPFPFLHPPPRNSRQNPLSFPCPSKDEHRDVVRQKAREAAAKDAKIIMERERASVPGQILRKSVSEDDTPKRQARRVGLGNHSGNIRKGRASFRGQRQGSEPRVSVSPSVHPSSTDDEEDGHDHVSALNKLAQQNKIIKDVTYSTSRRPTTTGPKVSLWNMQVTVTLLDNAESPTLSKDGLAKTLRKAKQKAAKHMLETVKGLAPEGTELEVLPTPASKPTQSATLDKGSGPVSHVGALNQLWHKGSLTHQPEFEYQAAEDAEGSQWKCTCLLNIKGKEAIVLKATAANKKTAKAMVSQMAFDRLIEEKVPDMDRFNIVLPPKPAPRENEADRPIEEDEEAVKNAVQMSDDEDGKKLAYDGKDIEFEGRLILPKGYTLVVAKSPQECKEWFEAHAMPGTDVGVFVDSWSARSSFGDIDAVVPDKAGGEDEVLPYPSLCFSSKASGLLLQVDNCIPDEQIGEPYVVDGFWIPEVLEDTLKDSRVRKHGHLLDDGVMRLWSLYGFHAKALHDVAATSYGVSALRSTGRNRILWSLRELAKHWLHKEFIGANAKEVWANVKGVPEEFLQAKNPKAETLATGVLSAYASVCVHEQVDLFAKKKRAELYGPASELLDLSRRLMQNPF